MKMFDYLFEFEIITLNGTAESTGSRHWQYLPSHSYGNMSADNPRVPAAEQQLVVGCINTRSQTTWKGLNNPFLSLQH